MSSTEHIADPDDTSWAKEIADALLAIGHRNPRDRGRWNYRVTGIGTNVFGVSKRRAMTVLADGPDDAIRIALERDSTMTEVDVWPTHDGPIA